MNPTIHLSISTRFLLLQKFLPYDFHQLFWFEGHHLVNGATPIDKPFHLMQYIGLKDKKGKDLKTFFPPVMIYGKRGILNAHILCV